MALRYVNHAMAALLSLVAGSAGAQLASPDLGKLLATGGVSQLEGAGGGGLTPWALVTGYGTRDSWGANAHATVVRTQDYALDVGGVAVGIADRFEWSLARQTFRGSRAPLQDLRLRQDIVGLKLRVAGDAVYGQDQWWPQVAVGLQYKRSGDVGGLGALGITSVRQLGARSEHGTDLYLAATKIDLARSLLWNGTLRFTRANQMGLLGFGGDKGQRYRPMFEGSLGYLVRRDLVAGVEYRMKPHNLGVDNEKDYYDAFVAWFPSKKVSVTAAYAVLGDITVFNPTRQKGLYVSVKAGY